MRAFVTGGTGFRGTHLVENLHRTGWELFVLHRPSSDLTELKKLDGLHLVPGDVTELESLRRGIPERVDAVFHVAGSAANLPYREEHTRYGINQGGARNVVTASLEKKVKRLIYTGTVLTYDFSRPGRVTEDFPPNDWCRDPYIHSKRLADIEMEKGVAAGLDVVFLHPSALFGAYDKATWSKMFLEIARGLPLPFAPPGGGSLSHAAPVATAHLAAYFKGRRGAHYILGGVDGTWLEVLQTVARIMGKPGPRAALPRALFKAYGWLEFKISCAIGREPMLTPHTIQLLSERIYSNSERAIRELAYKESSVETMLRDCYEWMVSAGMLEGPSDEEAGALADTEASELAVREEPR